ncbi:TetR/AcrR family transcriptional regulator [Microbulbifer guangxiensis]|uniref:TetR/AcrR family transcriptional regulator n=1 Tax=Microbulbifer guangxiensis TaxID=2904249 RepID=UPI001F277602|nr:TetR/AcrR family transcriptional regulator [Microbulbifer guangxiensis]
MPRRRYTTLPRKPQRKNGREKFETLLDTLDGLLQFRETSEISLSDLSEAAGVPAASVYHFFPNREALFAALMQRHLDTMADFHPLPAAADPSWQKRVEAFLDLWQERLCGSESVMKLRFGPAPGWAVRELLLEDRRRLGLLLLDRLDTDFELPATSRWDEHFQVAMTIAEGVWSGAYGRFGRVDDLSIREARRAVIAYLECFFGELLPLRIRAEEEALLD